MKLEEKIEIRCGAIVKIEQIKTWLKENPGCYYEFNRLADTNRGKNILHLQFFDSNKNEKKNMRLIVLKCYSSPDVQQKNIKSIVEKEKFWEVTTVDNKILKAKSFLCY